ncbi:hypothetical protein J1N35_022195, partial [Gossypium stocksii]
DGYRVLRLWFHFPKYDLNERIMSYLQLAGFGDVALIRRFDLSANLISALVYKDLHLHYAVRGVHYHIGRCHYATWVMS